MFIVMFSLMYDHLKLRITVFCYLRMNLLYLQSLWVLFTESTSVFTVDRWKTSLVSTSLEVEGEGRINFL